MVGSRVQRDGGEKGAGGWWGEGCRGIVWWEGEHNVCQHKDVGKGEMVLYRERERRGEEEREQEENRKR